jgi:hypothetical protein
LLEAEYGQDGKHCGGIVLITDGARRQRGLDPRLERPQAVSRRLPPKARSSVQADTDGNIFLQNGYMMLYLNKRYSCGAFQGCGRRL